MVTIIPSLNASSLMYFLILASSLIFSAIIFLLVPPSIFPIVRTALSKGLTFLEIIVLKIH